MHNSITMMMMMIIIIIIIIISVTILKLIDLTMEIPCMWKVKKSDASDNRGN
jgi:hypothetical protein